MGCWAGGVQGWGCWADREASDSDCGAGVRAPPHLESLLLWAGAWGSEMGGRGCLLGSCHSSPGPGGGAAGPVPVVGAQLRHGGRSWCEHHVGARCRAALLPTDRQWHCLIHLSPRGLLPVSACPSPSVRALGPPLIPALQQASPARACSRCLPRGRGSAGRFGSSHKAGPCPCAEGWSLGQN